MTDEADDLRRLLLAEGVLTSSAATLTPLHGGVSSEIYRVFDGERRFVVKRALAKLKVQEDWFANTERNYFEQAFLQYVAGFRPDAVPKLLHADRENGYFCMESLDGFSNWKDDLLAGNCDAHVARRAGVLLGEIHTHSWSDQAARRAFDTTRNFEQLRIDPYLRTTAARHPRLRQVLLAEAQRLGRTRKCLVHGDYSPKNLLHRADRLVALDCEVAWYGDPAFDLAFLLNHLLLKSLYHAPAAPPLYDLVRSVIDGYRSSNPLAEELESGTARLLPMLMLARVDGKSPVEYLNDDGKPSLVRAFAEVQLLRPKMLDLGPLIEAWFEAVARYGSTS